MRVEPLLHRLGCWSPALPAMYDQSISYLELIGHLLAKVEECIKAVNDLDEMNKDYIDNQIFVLKSYVNAQIDAVNRKHDADIAQVYIVISDTFSDIIKAIDDSATKTKVELILYINELLKDVGKSIIVKNPINGLWQDIQTVIDSLYDVFRFLALTALEYDSLELSAQAYDNKMLNAIDYDMFGVMSISERFTSMVDPFTGELSDMRYVIQKLVSFHSGGYMAEEYDAKQFTATAFADFDLTAYEWDFQGKSLTS